MRWGLMQKSGMALCFRRGEDAQPGINTDSVSRHEEILEIAGAPND